MLPRWLRQWMARYLAYRAPEYGGTLHDYANGRWKLLNVWSDNEGLKDGSAVLEDMIFGSRDEIYVVTAKCGDKHGYFTVEQTGKAWPFIRAFWAGLYEPEEAYAEVEKKCREIADKMGYRRPDENR